MASSQMAATTQNNGGEVMPWWMQKNIADGYSLPFFAQVQPKQPPVTTSDGLKPGLNAGILLIVFALSVVVTKKVLK
jgi:hypothetical protein